MGKEGIEPSTSRFGNVHSYPLSYKPSIKKFFYVYTLDLSWWIVVYLHVPCLPHTSCQSLIGTKQGKDIIACDYRSSLCDDASSPMIDYHRWCNTFVNKSDRSEDYSDAKSRAIIDHRYAMMHHLWWSIIRDDATLLFTKVIDHSYILMQNRLRLSIIAIRWCKSWVFTKRSFVYTLPHTCPYGIKVKYVDFHGTVNTSH